MRVSVVAFVAMTVAVIVKSVIIVVVAAAVASHDASSIPDDVQFLGIREL